MYFPSAVLVLAGLSSLAAAYDDGMYHPDQLQSPTTTATTTTTRGTTYLSSSVVPEIYKTSEYSAVTTTAYATLSRSTYVGYWSQNTTATVTSAYKSSNTTVSAKPGNFSRTTTTADRIYTTTVCDFQNSCYTTVATATSGVGLAKATPTVQPTMMPFSSSERLVAGGWAALALCGVAVLL